jgi:hypothetical protein
MDVVLQNKEEYKEEFNYYITNKGVSFILDFY